MEELRKIKLNIPSWAARLYILISLAMIPWVIYLGYKLPLQHISRNWDITWIGLDVAQISALLTTGILARLSSIYMLFFAPIAGTLFLTDAWFDILGYKVGAFGFNQALLMAAFGEIPLTVMSFALTIHGLKRLHAKKYY